MAQPLRGNEVGSVGLVIFLDNLEESKNGIIKTPVANGDYS